MKPRAPRLPRENSRCVQWCPTGRLPDAGAPVDFVASEQHWLEHLAPVWQQLQHRGRFYTPDHLAPQARRLGVKRYPLPAQLPSGGPVVVASYGDLRRVAKADRYLVLFEHGAGFSFSRPHPSYAGGLRWRCLVSLFACPNEYVAARNRAAYPEAMVEVVGSPKMDAVFTSPQRPAGTPPVVAVGFHWDCKVAPETRWAYPHYSGAMGALCDTYQVLAHAHPRCPASLRQELEAAGAEWVPDWQQVLERADIYLNDSSSTLYEFAATGRPVVVLNAPWYRRDVQHGLRFWEHADVGVQVDDPFDLLDAVDLALRDLPAQRKLRSKAVRDVYPVRDGTSAAQAAALLDDWPATLREHGRPKAHSAPKRTKLPAGCGVVYLALSEQARAYVQASAPTLLAQHDVQVAVAGQEPLDGYQWLPVQHTTTAPQAALQAPFKRCLVLAPDTQVVGPLSAPYAALAAGWDMALAVEPAPGPAWGASPVRRSAGTDDVLRYATAATWWRRGPAADAVLRAWAQLLAEGAAPEVALAAAVHQEPAQLWLLAQEWCTSKRAVAKHVHHLAEVKEVSRGRRRRADALRV